MNNKPFLSVIIPCYNSEKTIRQTMESILLNKLDEGEMEVIVVDDRSTDNSMTIVREYEKELNIRYVETTRSVHCAGNTRQAAFPYIRGEWFTCIDSDDSFEPDVLPKVKEFLENHDVKYTLCTNFRGYNPFKDQYDHSYLCEHCDTWLHGKFFNTKKTLIEFGCYFPEDLVSHEDTFFNCMNLANIIARGSDYVRINLFTYKWTYNPNSLTRSKENGVYFYVERYLDEYVYSSTEPYFQMLKTIKTTAHREWFIHQIMMSMLHAYFYHQATVWRMGYDYIPKNITVMHELKLRMINELEINEFDIINYVHNNPVRYDSIKRSCENGTCAFIETQSFRDFVLNL